MISKLLTMVAIVFTYFILSNSTTIAESSISFTHFFAAYALIFTIMYYSTRSNGVYLVDFICYTPADHLRMPISNFIEHLEVSNVFNQESLDFQEKVVERAGVGNEACMPTVLHEIPPDVTLKLSREEIEEVLFTAVKDLFSRHKINPKSIDILVSNCSLFCPTPSISSMIINKFGLRSNIKSFSLSGMGCSAGMLSISLVKDLLKVHKNSLALVLSIEAVTPNGYKGCTKSMLIANTIFRMGGAAILLSNRHKDKHIAKYKLQHLIRTHMGSDDQSYLSVIQQEDEDGKVGVSLSRSLVPGKKELHVPNFRKAFQHFCIHAGGRSIIQAVEDNLRLHKEDGEASRMTLHRFGNTSSSSVWYELCYLEAKGKMKKGDQVWQIAFGSGFKTNSAVWKCISDLNPDLRNAWSDRIHFYPVNIPNIL